MENILVPTDFSFESHHAFEVAVRLAARIGGSVLLLHAVELPEMASLQHLWQTGGRHGAAQQRQPQ
ncbi:universal stress protein [Hymenobacter swuensis]|uniref:UspA domain-containing protein n=1 Tax=Hymenobacter swuensis DY53 TaxID=1227739 RepID=W8EUB1_9BACT|nr:universal stress protein [Hymenobacter swuensis]AHJ95357.1 hypothetical protein Hsw_PA0024 [Hymenobacter swuensis DY53]